MPEHEQSQKPRAAIRLPMGRIVELTVMEQPTVSGVVAQLEREGLARRKDRTRIPASSM